MNNVHFFNKSTRNHFLKKAASAKVLLIAELHGSKENILVTAETIRLLRRLKYTTLAYEWPHTFERPLQRVLSTGKYPKSITRFTLTDGRLSRSHLELLRKLAGLRPVFPIELVCYDPDFRANWNRVESAMAKLLARRLNRVGKMIVVAGRLHAQGKPFFLHNRRVYPLGHILRVRMHFRVLTLHLVYCSGSIRNGATKRVTRSKVDYGFPLPQIQTNSVVIVPGQTSAEFLCLIPRSHVLPYTPRIRKGR